MSRLAWVGGRTFASLRNHRNFRLYFASHAVSFAGTWMQQIAAYWLVLELTGSPVAVGALALAQLLPVTVFGLAVGQVIDRVDVRRLLLFTESILSAAALTLAVLTLTGAIQLWQVYAIGVLQGLVLTLGNPARHTLVFRIVGTADLPNAVALSSGLGTMARIVGPGLGGLVVALAGPGVAFAVNSATFGATVTALLAMRVKDLIPFEAAPGRASYRALGRFVFLDRRVTVAFFAVLFLSTVSFNFDVLLPLVARQTLDAGADVFGLIAAIFGAGALCGALFLATVGRASLRLLLLGAGGFGVLELALAPQDSVLAVCLLLVPIGICYVVWGSSALASLQLAAPPHLRGQAASLYFFAFQGGAPLGGLLAGWLTSKGGTGLAFAVAGASAVVVAVVGAAALLPGSSRSRGEPEGDEIPAEPIAGPIPGR
ncbi:MAG TPA: MFS transporter [Gaiellaceae bacterium]|nr:MFS transporter [Gaiellaceae bacterium]